MNDFAKRSRTARRSRPLRLLVSCEHGGNRVPARYVALFSGAADVLDSHRGLDYGALELARAFGRELGVEPFTATTSRLVVDLNRSPHHRNVLSQYTRRLSREQRARTMTAHYWPYRNAVDGYVDRAVADGESVLHGEVRNCDIAFLYDPARRAEVRFIAAWSAALRAAAPALAQRRNYPYRGTSDALVTHLRRRHGDRRYAGVELEVNQKHFGSRGWRALVEVLATTLATAVAAI